MRGRQRGEGVALMPHLGGVRAVQLRVVGVHESRADGGRGGVEFSAHHLDLPVYDNAIRESEICLLRRADR